MVWPVASARIWFSVSRMRRISLRVNIDIGGLTGEAAHGRLVNQNPRMRQAIALALGPAGEQHRRHGRGLPHAGGHDIGLDQPHRVENRQARP